MHKISKPLKRELQIWLGSGALLVGFLVATDPLKLPLPILLVPFGIFLVWTRSAVIALGLILWRQPTPSRKLKVIAGSVAAVLLLIVTLQSLGQLSVRDVALIFSLVGVLALYFYKTDLI